ncbi:hypothetical protein STEG23_030468 [Scotinomys teguina]
MGKVVNLSGAPGVLCAVSETGCFGALWAHHGMFSWCCTDFSPMPPSLGEFAKQVFVKEQATFDDVAVKFTLEEWALLNSNQKKLYSGEMKETFLNLISIGKALKEKFGEDCKDLGIKMGSQVIKKECGYACDSDCDNNLDLM